MNEAIKKIYRKNKNTRMRKDENGRGEKEGDRVSAGKEKEGKERRGEAHDSPVGS